MGESKTPTHFLKMMQNMLKPLAKIQEKWVRNIHAKNSEVLELNEYYSDCFWSGQK
jgi:hypothetical protein